MFLQTNNGYMQKIKVAMVDDRYRMYRNDLVKALDKTSVSITVISPYNDKDSGIIRGGKWLTPISKYKSYLRVRPLRVLSYFLIRENNILLRDKFIDELKPTVIHMQGISFPLLELLVGKAFDIPKVITVHNIFPHEKSLYNLYNYPQVVKKAYDKMGFNAFVVHSEILRKRLCSFYPPSCQRINVIPHGCNGEVKIVKKKEARNALNLSKDIYPLILFLGGIRRYKGLKYLINALPHLFKDYPKGKLIIAGRPMYEKFSRYNMIIRKMKLEDKIILRIGYIPEEEANFYFQAADLTVLPYTRFTAQSGVLLRAYANQCPVVVTDVGAMGELVREDSTGIVVPPESSKALEGGILEILSDRVMQEKVKRNMKAAVQEKYNWEKIAEETVALYNQVL